MSSRTFYTPPSGSAPPSGLNLSAAEHGALAWTESPAVTTAALGCTSGTAYFNKTKIAQSGTPTAVMFRTGTAATTTTLFKVSVFDAAGVEIATGSSLTLPNLSGDATLALTATRPLVAGEVVYVGILWIGTGTFTMLGTSAASALNLGNTAAAGANMFRSSTVTGVTDMPTALPFASTAAANNVRLLILK